MWQKYQLKEMRFIDCEQTMFGKIALWSAEMGFEFCSFAMRAPLPVTNPTGMAISNYPEILKQTYERADYVSIDPLIQQALSSVELIIWTADERFARDPEVLHAARSAGALSGVSQPTRGSHGVAGLLNLSAHNRAISAAEVEEKKTRIIWLANIAHQGLSPYLIENYLPGAGAKLTDREIAVLRWLAEGKVSNEIADILNISERTVNFHTNNATKKLGAPNRTAAAVQAAMLGLLE
ncbi:MAG: autoinducer binding domain-containing protein [Nitrosomonadales bacterium]|nr:autoinducer binding domain-containing protein [Nitrosomonadales bacterium]